MLSLNDILPDSINGLVLHPNLCEILRLGQESVPQFTLALVLRRVSDLLILDIQKAKLLDSVCFSP